MPPVPADTSRLVFGSIELRLAERALRVEGQPVTLGSRGFDLLQALVRKRERVVTKDELLDEVWPGLVVEENNLQVQVSGLRRVLGAGAIATIPGIGYRFMLSEGAVHDSGAASGPAVPPAPTMSAVASARVLVADDNRVNRLLLCRALELMGHQVGSADNGRRALALMREQRFDLLLLDLAMPELDGFGLLLARLDDAALHEVAVIVTSALGGVAPVASCIELGADDFLHKPVDPWLLKARVDSSLMRKQQRDEQAAALRRATPVGPTGPGARADATVLVARLHGLDDIGTDTDTDTEPTPPQVLDVVNDWSTLVLDAIQVQGGEVVQFRGDVVMALFTDARSAVRAADDLVELLRLFAAEVGTAHPWAAGRGIRTGIGVARGPVTVGRAAVARHTACACIGAAVTRAESLAAACTQEGPAYRLDDAAQAGLASPPLAG